jgi:hypothetical protein
MTDGGCSTVEEAEHANPADQRLSLNVGESTRSLGMTWTYRNLTPGRLGIAESSSAR